MILQKFLCNRQRLAHYTYLRPLLAALVAIEAKPETNAISQMECVKLIRCAFFVVVPHLPLRNFFQTIPKNVHIPTIYQVYFPEIWCNKGTRLIDTNHSKHNYRYTHLKGTPPEVFRFCNKNCWVGQFLRPTNDPAMCAASCRSRWHGENKSQENPTKKRKVYQFPKPVNRPV